MWWCVWKGGGYGKGVLMRGYVINDRVCNESRRVENMGYIEEKVGNSTRTVYPLTTSNLSVVYS